MASISHAMAGMGSGGGAAPGRGLNSTGLHRCCARRGFTLLEVILAIIIVGTGFTAAMQLFVTTAQQNQAAGSMTVAINLGNNIQELMAGACYVNPAPPNAQDPWTTWKEKTPSLTDPNRDIDDYDQVTYSPPLDAGGQSLSTTPLSRYTQHIDVSMLNHKDFKTVVASDEGVRRVVVTVSYLAPGASTSLPVYTLTFYRFNDLTAKGPNEK